MFIKNPPYKLQPLKPQNVTDKKRTKGIAQLYFRNSSRRKTAKHISFG